MVSRKSKQLTARIKDVREGRGMKKKVIKLTNEDKIKELESQIKLCEYDLSGNFPDNIAIQNKLKSLTENLEKLKNENNKTT